MALDEPEDDDPELLEVPEVLDDSELVFEDDSELVFDDDSEEDPDDAADSEGFGDPPDPLRLSVL